MNTMTPRQRLMATLRGEQVDRPAVNFYEIGGFAIDPADPDPFNVYNDPSWQPLLELAENHTDLIRIGHPKITRPDDPRVRVEHWQENNSRFWRTIIRVGSHTLTSLDRHDAAVNTVWNLEHLLKDSEDLRAYLDFIKDVPEESIDVAPLLEAETRLGDRGIVMVDTADPLCRAAGLFSMEDFTVAAFTEQKLFHELLQHFARILHRRTEIVAKNFPGRLWRIVGPEYASEPFLPNELFQQYVVRYTAPMVRIIQQHGGFARVHCHGRIKNLLPHFLAMGADATDPIEPAPQGDVTLEEVRRTCGHQLVLFGNIEIRDIELLAPPAFEKIVRQTLREATAAPARGFVLMPSAAPYGRHIPQNVLENYRTMVRCVNTL